MPFFLPCLIQITCMASSAEELLVGFQLSTLYDYDYKYERPLEWSMLMRGCDLEMLLYVPFHAYSCEKLFPYPYRNPIPNPATPSSQFNKLTALNLYFVCCLVSFQESSKIIVQSAHKEGWLISGVWHNAFFYIFHLFCCIFLDLCICIAFYIRGILRASSAISNAYSDTLTSED